MCPDLPALLIIMLHVIEFPFDLFVRFVGGLSRQSVC